MNELRPSAADGSRGEEPSDAELVSRLAPASESATGRGAASRAATGGSTSSEDAWRALLERHASFMLAELERIGLDYDSAMDAFVSTCERLAEDGFRRLRSVRDLEDGRSLEPWLRTVVGRVATDRRWARFGRRRVFAAVKRLGPLEQQVFRLGFWAGKRPSEMIPELLAGGLIREPTEAFGAWERVLEAVGAAGARHLAVSTARRSAAQLAPLPEAAVVVSTDPDPEQQAVARDQLARLEAGLEQLAPRARLIVRLRYDDGLGFAEIADLLGLSSRTVRRELETTLAALRRRLAPAEARQDGGP